MGAILKTFLIFSLFFSLNYSYAKSKKITFHSKKYDVFLQMKEMNVDVVVGCQNKNFEEAYIINISGAEDYYFGGYYYNQRYIIKDDLYVYKEEQLIGTLNTPINLENTELISDADRDKCYNTESHYFHVNLNGRLTITPAPEINFFSAINNYRCKYDRHGTGSVFMGRKNAQDLYFFIVDNENKIIDQDHRMLGWNNNKCMSLQSFVGGTVQITESVIGTIITAPIILLWILLGLPAPQT